MYSQKIIKQKLLELRRQGTELIYNSPSVAQAAIPHFTSIAVLDDEGEFVEWRRELDQAERQFLNNEAMLSQIDFLYAASRYAKIMDWQKQLVLFNPNIAQRIKLDVYAELEERELAIIVQALKARQLGSSTEDELIVWHRSLFCPHTNAIVGSSDPTKSAKMFQMVERAWQHTPFYLKPKCTKYSTGEFYDFGNIDSHISIQHGTQFSGIGRGDTPNVAHLSEIVDYDNPKQLIDASLLRALHETKGTFLVLESTANGRGDYWHETWQINKANQAEGIAKMYPMFLPWFVGSDIYPTNEWLKARPVPQGWEPAESTIQHAVKAAEYVATTPLLTKHLGTGWSMPVQQMWWYEVERKWATQKNELNIFLSECPANDEEAFQSRSGSIFSVEVISERRDSARLPKYAYSITGEGISERLVSSVKHHMPGMPAPIVGHRTPAGRQLQWRFNQLIVDSRFDPLNKLCVWELPKDGETYEIAVDTGYGIGEDRTVVQVGRRSAYGNADAQVAEWASSQAGALDIWPVVLAIGRMYSTLNPEGGLVEPRVTIEMAANGEALQAELRKLGWRRFYIRTRLGTQVNPDRIIEPLLGWATTWTSRPKLLDHLIKVVRDGLVEIRSPWLVDELADLQRSEKQLKIEAAKGSHDDRLMAFAILCYTMYDLDVRGETTAAYRHREEEAKRASLAPTWQPSHVELPEPNLGLEWL